jgi:hypothetical protein
MFCSARYAIKSDVYGGNLWKAKVTHLSSHIILAHKLPSVPSQLMHGGGLQSWVGAKCRLGCLHQPGIMCLDDITQCLDNNDNGNGHQPWEWDCDKGNNNQVCRSQDWLS